MSPRLTAENVPCSDVTRQRVRLYRCGRCDSIGHLYYVRVLQITTFTHGFNLENNKKTSVTTATVFSNRN